MAKFMQGFYKPENPGKYKGDVSNIVYRSSYELTYLRKLDTDPDVLQYSSEEVIIPYRNPSTNRVHRYFIDFYVKKKDKDGKISEHLIEIKPSVQTVPPTLGKKKRKTIIKETVTYSINEAKWAAARTYCKKMGWHFHIITEKELYGSNTL